MLLFCYHRLHYKCPVLDAFLVYLLFCSDNKKSGSWSQMQPVDCEIHKRVLLCFFFFFSNNKNNLNKTHTSVTFPHHLDWKKNETLLLTFGSLQTAFIQIKIYQSLFQPQVESRLYYEHWLIMSNYCTQQQQQQPWIMW